MQRLVLFDIDGTLLLTGHIGQAAAKITMQAVYGLTGNFDQYYPSGRTMEAILWDTLQEEGLSEEAIESKKPVFYQAFFTEFERRLANGTHDIRPLGGGIELVETLRERDDAIVGLVTANHTHTAELKLSTAGYNFGWFEVGGYGHQSRVRSDLVGIAQNQAEELTQAPIKNNHTIVIGDTVKDIEAAKGAGVRCISVCTGNVTKVQLAQAEPDCLLDDLEDTAAALAAIFQA